MTDQISSDTADSSYSAMSHSMSASLGFCPADFLEIGCGADYTLAAVDATSPGYAYSRDSGNLGINPYIRLALANHYRFSLGYSWGSRRDTSVSSYDDGYESKGKNSSGTGAFSIGMSLRY